MLFGNGLPSWAQNLYVLIGILTVDSTAPLKHPTVRFWVGVSSVLISAIDSIKQHHDVDLPYHIWSLTLLIVDLSSCFSFAVFVASAAKKERSRICTFALKKKYWFQTMFTFKRVSMSNVQFIMWVSNKIDRSLFFSCWSWNAGARATTWSVVSSGYLLSVWGPHFLLRYPPFLPRETQSKTRYFY